MSKTYSSIDWSDAESEDSIFATIGFKDMCFYLENSKYFQQGIYANAKRLFNKGPLDKL